MQSAQVSVWVPIVVGIIGLLGVVLGQLINTRRERTRENIRWHRELERERGIREHETQVYWRDRRLEVYSECLSLLHRWSETLLLAGRHVHAEHQIRADHAERLATIRLDSEEVTGRIELLGSDRFIDNTIETIENYKARAQHLAEGRLPPVDEGDIETFADAVQSQFYRARHTARQEFSIAEEGGR